ncbi:MAG: hypothetical protein ABTQ26_12275 [Azonexus sp.]
MLDQQQNKTNPLGPLASAAQLAPPMGDSIKPAGRNPLLSDTKPVGNATDPDTDGRRPYSLNSGKAFAYRADANTAATSSINSPAVGNPLAGVTEPPAAEIQQAQKPAANPLLATIASDVPANSVNLVANNESMAKTNAMRQAMIDSQVGNGTGQPVSWQDQHGNADPEKQRIADSNALLNKWDKQYQNGQMVAEMGRNPKAANAIAALVGAAGHDETNLAAQNNNAAIADGREATARRGQDITAQTQSAQIAGNPLDNLLKQTQVQGGQQAVDKAKQHNDAVSAISAETDPNKRKTMIENLLAAQGKNPTPNDGAERLSLPQQRSNAEIDAARNAVAGLTPQEIQRKTAKTTNTGRENPDFDPTLERAVTLAGRRKVGADDHFDQRQQGQQPAGNDGDVTTRFKADQAMAGHTLGKQTELGTEVLDRAGKIIGHYR